MQLVTKTPSVKVQIIADYNRHSLFLLCNITTSKNGSAVRINYQRYSMVCAL